MFRYIATIGFLCLSAGSIAAEKAPDQNTVENSKIEKALADLLDKRAAWGSGPGQAAAADDRLALKGYLAHRESWGTAPQGVATPADHIALTLGAYLARRDAWGTAPAANSADDRLALNDYLARRDSWGTAPAATSADGRLALQDYLARRDSWGTAPAASADGRFALNDYLARRDSWGAAPQAVATSADGRLALQDYLARRDSWGTAPAATSADGRLALKDYLARRDSWGVAPAANVQPVSDSQIRAELNALLLARQSLGDKPALSVAREATDLDRFLARRDAWGPGPKAKSARVEIAASAPGVQTAEARPSPVITAPDATVITAELARLLSKRASWGASPAISSAEADVSQPVVALEPDINRRTQGSSTAKTRFAALAPANATRSDAVTCTEALRQITHSSRIHFAAGSALLTTENSGKLERLVAAGRDCASLRLRIEGHTDSLGDAAKNQALSKKRAAAVANYLETAGINAAALEAVGLGESRPLVPNTTRANRARNRRIEFVLLAN